MRIAFVGKGGSGKTTMSALFSLFLKNSSDQNVWAIDADINMHLGEQLNFDVKSSNLKHISNPDSEKDIKNFLKGENSKIKQISHFKKTTPPTQNSNFINVSDSENYIFKNYSINNANLFFSLVGTYESENIGASCYHNNLSVLENILTHSIDKNSSIVVDMVAGVDAFAGSLHALFDMIILVVEPTKKSLEVHEQYKKLSVDAGVWDSVYIIGNKISSESDVEFLENNIDREKLIGYFVNSEHIKESEQGRVTLDLNKLENSNKEVLSRIYEKLKNRNTKPSTRLNKIYELHRKYVAQASVKDRFGDLSDQIDINFDIDKFVENYE